jgi:hypothetical protein
MFDEDRKHESLGGVMGVRVAARGAATHRRYMLCDLVCTSPTRMEKGSPEKSTGFSPVEDLKCGGS